MKSVETYPTKCISFLIFRKEYAMFITSLLKASTVRDRNKTHHVARQEAALGPPHTN